MDPEGVPDVGVPDEPELPAPLEPDEPLSEVEPDEPLLSLDVLSLDDFVSPEPAGLSSLDFFGAELP